MLALAFAIAFCLLVSWFDLKTRIIPDGLTVGGTVLGFALSVALRAAEPGFLAGYIAMVLVGLAAGYALYLSGVWAGGDAKLFWSLSAMLGLFGYSDPAMPLLVLGAGLAAFVPAVLAGNLKLVFENRGKIPDIAVQAARRALKSGAAWTLPAVALQSSVFLYAALAIILVSIEVPAWLSALLLLAAAIVDAQKSAFAFVTGFAAIFSIGTLASVFGRIISPSLSARVGTGDLKEGMLPAQAILVRKGRVRRFSPSIGFRRILAALRLGQKDPVGIARSAGIIPPAGWEIIASPANARGLEAGEIVRLKRLKKIRWLKIRKTTAFAPALCFGFLLFCAGAWPKQFLGAFG